MIDFHSQLAIIPQVYETAQLQDNLEHSGGISVSWKSADDTEIPIGSYVTYNGLRYILLDPYAPTCESASQFSEQGGVEKVAYYKYDPQFKHPQNMLDKKPFWIKSKDSLGNDLKMRTTSYTGFPYVIAQKLVDFMAEYANEVGDTFFAETMGLELEHPSQPWDATTNPWKPTWHYHISSVVDSNGNEINAYTIVTVSFDSCSIKSAVDALASAMGCNVYWDWSYKDYNEDAVLVPRRTIRFVAGSTIQGETYNSWTVLGGTTNMGKTTVSGGYAAVTQRLTLRDPEPDDARSEEIQIKVGNTDKTFYLLKGSIISNAEPGGLILAKDLILDSVYPKMELYVRTARERECYLTDENGDYILDEVKYYYMDGDVKVYTVLDHESDGKYYDAQGHELTRELVYKTFSKWYVTLSTDKTAWDKEHQTWEEYVQYAKTHWTQYTTDPRSILINDKPLGLLFQVDYRNPDNMSKLVGWQFEATYFHDAGTEPREKNDVDKSEPWEILRHDYYINFSASGSQILPGKSVMGEVTEGGVTVVGECGMVPKVGDKVTLVNVALTNDQINNAKTELMNSAKEIIGLEQTPAGEYTETVIFGDGDFRIPPVMVGDASPFDCEKHGPVVTNVNLNLDTNVAEVTVGSWTRKTKTGGQADKIETVSVTSASPTTGGQGYGDGSLGPGSYQPNTGTSSQESNTISTTTNKADAPFNAYLNNTIDVIACDADGKVKDVRNGNPINIWTRISARYGTRDVTPSCLLYVPEPTADSTGKKVRIYQETESGGTSGQEVDYWDNDHPNNANDLTNGKEWLRFEFPIGFNMSEFEDKQVFPLIVGHPYHGERGLSFTVGAQKEAENGTSPLVADLDNEMQSIACLADGKPKAQTTVSTNLSLYNGSNKANFKVTTIVRKYGDNSTSTFDSNNTTSDGVTVILDHDFNPNPASNVNKLTVTYATNAVITEKDDFTINMTDADGGNPRSLHFIVNGISSGAIYDLLVEPDTIHATRADGGYYSNDATVVCGYTKNDNNVVTSVNEVTGVFDGYNVFFRLHARTGSWGPYRAYSDKTMPNYSIQPVNVASYDAVELVLGTGSMDSGGGYSITKALDRETIRVVADGVNGTNGRDADVWTIGADGYWYKNGVKTDTKAEGKDGTGVELKGSVDVLFNSAGQTSLEELTSPPVAIGDCYVVESTRHLYFYDGTTAATLTNPTGWRDIGEFKGAPGDNAYVHIAYASSDPTGVTEQTVNSIGFTVTKGNTDYPWLGLCTDNNVNDPGYNWSSLTNAEKVTAVNAYEWNYVKGEQGESVIQLTLDNEHEDFLYNDSGTRIAPTGDGAISNVHLWNGNTEITTGIKWSFTTDEGTNWSVDTKRTIVTNSQARLRLYNRVLTVFDIYAQSVKVKVRAEYPSESGNFYYADFTANKAGYDKYDLVVSPNAIAYNPADYYQQPVTVTLGASRTDIQGTTTNLSFGADGSGVAPYSVISNVQNSGYLRMFVTHYVNGTVSLVRQLTSSFQATDLEIQNINGYNVELRKYEDSSSADDTGYSVVDYETIEIAKVENGQDGSDGSDGSDGDGYTIFSEPNSLVYDPSAMPPSFVGGDGFVLHATHNGVTCDGASGITLYLEGIDSAGNRTVIQDKTLNQRVDASANFVRYDATLKANGVSVASCSASITRYGQAGSNGLQGCVIRVSEYVQGHVGYRNDEGQALAAGAIGYIDVVGIDNPSDPYGYTFYRYKSSETSTASTPGPTDSGGSNYWEQLTNVGPIFTSLLVAKNAYIKFGTGNRFVMTDDNGHVNAGMKGTNDENPPSSHGGIRFWAGSDPTGNPAKPIKDSPYRVYNDGHAVLESAEVHGAIYAESGLFEGTVRADNFYYSVETLVSNGPISKGKQIVIIAPGVTSVSLPAPSQDNEGAVVDIYSYSNSVQINGTIKHPSGHTISYIGMTSETRSRFYCEGANSWEVLEINVSIMPNSNNN